MGNPTGIATFEREGLVSSDRGTVLGAFDRPTGTLHWCKALAPITMVGRTVPRVVAAGGLAASFDGDDIVGLASFDGTERWRRARPPGGANLFGGERVIVLDDLNSIVATLDPTDGTTDDTFRAVLPPDCYAYSSHPSTIGGLSLHTSPASIPNGQRIDIEIPLDVRIRL